MVLKSIERLPKERVSEFLGCIWCRRYKLVENVSDYLAKSLPKIYYILSNKSKKLISLAK